MPLKGVERSYGAEVCYRVPKSEFEKENLQRMKTENIKFKAKRLDNGEWIIGSFVVMKIPALSKKLQVSQHQTVQRFMKLTLLLSVSSQG